MASFIVYAHTSPSGNRYVGWTSQSGNARWTSHVSQARRGADECPAFHRAIRKYGSDAFAHEVLERMTTEAGAKRAERLWIERLGTRSPGYNLSDGGDGALGRVYAPTPETLAKLSKALTGRKHSAETRAKMSASQRAAHARGGRPNISDWKRGRALTGESETKRREALRAARARLVPEERAARNKAASEVARKLWADPAYRERISNGHRGRVVSAETRAKIAATLRGKRRQ